MLQISLLIILYYFYLKFTEHPYTIPRYLTKIANKKLINVSDSAKYSNPDTEAKRGPIEPLYFKCGMNIEFHREASIPKRHYPST